MKITKVGHCCLLVELEAQRILTDPGNFSAAQNDLKDINLILITHEHPDHLHMASLLEVLNHNPDAKVITNSSVGKILTDAQVKFEVLEHGQSRMQNGSLLEAFGNEHAEIYQGYSRVQNTGYFIENRLFYPGDALYNPGKSVEILALPVAGPWVKISEAVNFAKQMKPKVCFPVHDGMLKFYGGAHGVPEQYLPPEGIAFKVLDLERMYQF